MTDLVRGWDEVKKYKIPTNKIRVIIHGKLESVKVYGF